MASFVRMVVGQKTNMTEMFISVRVPLLPTMFSPALSYRTQSPVFTVTETFLTLCRPVTALQEVMMVSGSKRASTPFFWYLLLFGIYPITLIEQLVRSPSKPSTLTVHCSKKPLVAMLLKAARNSGACANGSAIFMGILSGCWMELRRINISYI